MSTLAPQVVAVSTATLQTAKYEAELARPSKFNPAEIRLSEAGQCPRRQTLRALGFVSTPPSLREMAIFETGHLAEERITDLWAQKFPLETLEREVEVRTEFGVGHIDLWVAPMTHMVECKTTTEKRLKDLPLQSHVAQVTMYLHFWGNARGATAEIAYLLKETGEIRSYPVVYDPHYARELLIGLMEVQGAITILREPLAIPDEYQATSYPCAWYSPQGLRRCGFWDHCWGNKITTMPEKKEVVAVAEPLTDDIHEYVKIRQQQEALNSQHELLDIRRDALEAGFNEITLERGANLLRAGDITLKRSDVSGRTTTSLKEALAAGVVTEAALVPYQTKHPGYHRWTVRKPRAQSKKKETK